MRKREREGEGSYVPAGNVRTELGTGHGAREAANERSKQSGK